MHKACRADGLKKLKELLLKSGAAHRLPSSRTIHVTPVPWTFGIFCISERILRNFISNSQSGERGGGRASTEDFPLRFSTKWSRSTLNGQIFWVSLCLEMLPRIENVTLRIFEHMRIDLKFTTNQILFICLGVWKDWLGAVFILLSLPLLCLGTATLTRVYVYILFVMLQK